MHRGIQRASWLSLHCGSRLQAYLGPKIWSWVWSTLWNECPSLVEWFVYFTIPAVRMNNFLLLFSSDLLYQIETPDSSEKHDPIYKRSLNAHRALTFLTFAKHLYVQPSIFSFYWIHQPSLFPWRFASFIHRADPPFSSTLTQTISNGPQASILYYLPDQTTPLNQPFCFPSKL